MNGKSESGLEQKESARTQKKSVRMHKKSAKIRLNPLFYLVEN